MNNNESFELEEMRQQMTLLKKKLEQQEIINERMASKAKASLEKKVEKLNQGFKGSWILAILMIPLGYYEIVGKLGFSVAFFIFSCLYIPLRLLYIHRDRSKLRDKSLFEGSLVEAQKTVALAKNHFCHGFKYDLILNVVYLVWFVWEVYQNSIMKAPRAGLFIVAILLGFCLFLWGFFFRRRQFKDVLNQIDELTSNVE